MKKSLISLVIAAAAALLINGCAAKVAHEDIKGKTITVKSGGWYEDCDKMAPGDKLNFSFKSSKPVMYEIHYHQRNAKFNFKDMTLADTFKGSFKVQKDAVYCCMFQNDNPDSITLTYNLSVEKR